MVLISSPDCVFLEIDLTPFDAYSQGVSRLHANVKIKEDDILLEDLGSSNGTRINNSKLDAHKDYPIQHGDVIALGRFKVQALIKQE